jgi:hypothetical protein
MQKWRRVTGTMLIKFGLAEPIVLELKGLLDAPKQITNCVAKDLSDISTPIVALHRGQD